MKKGVLMKGNAAIRLEEYAAEMRAMELSESTIKKYLSDIKKWLSIMDEEICKEDVLGYRNSMVDTYKATSVNSKIISINRYLKWLGYEELVVKTRKIQGASSLDNTISKEDYWKMLEYAKTHKRMKMYYIMKTIAQTGIRIGELKFITVEAVMEGATAVWNKGKFRTVYFNDKLCKELLLYCTSNSIRHGVIFTGRKEGAVLTAAAVWKGLKYIARKVNIPETIVYPHSFRHLFAKEYMRNIGDISELADLLGHSRLETTWIYTKTTSQEKRKRLERLEL